LVLKINTDVIVSLKFWQKNSVETTCLNYQVSTPMLPANCSTPYYYGVSHTYSRSITQLRVKLWKNDSSRIAVNRYFICLVLCSLAHFFISYAKIINEFRAKLMLYCYLYNFLTKFLNILYIVRIEHCSIQMNLVILRSEY